MRPKTPPKTEKPHTTDPGATATASSIPVHCAHAKLADITTLVPNPRNPNKHGDRQIALLAKVIKHQGWRSPIVVSNRSGFIVAGHGRLDAAKLLQVETVPVDFQDFTTEADEWAHLVADNRIAELAEINSDELGAILKELDGKIDLDLTGFDVNALDVVFQQETDPQGEWEGMPEFHNEPKAARTILVHFKTQEDAKQFAETVGQSITDKTKFLWFPKQEAAQGKNEFATE